MVIVITLQSQFASLAQKSARNYSASRHEFTESKADETFRVIYINLNSMAARRDIDRTYKCVSEWRFFLVKSCICSIILSCFWQPYECVTGISKVFLEVVSHYVCYSVCVSIFEKNSKVKFLIFFAWVVSFVFLMWDRCGSFWDRPRSFEDRCGSLWDRCGSLWVVVDRCGSLWVVPGFSNYDLRMGGFLGSFEMKKNFYWINMLRFPKQPTLVVTPQFIQFFGLS